MHSHQINLNGVPLPDEFKNGTFINGIAISKDRSTYAVVGDDRKLIIGKIPESGLLEINGTTITLYKDGGIGCVSQSVSLHNTVILGSFTTVVGKGGTSHIGAKLEIDQSFDDVRDLILQSSDAGLEFKVHNANSVKVKGSSAKVPMNDNGLLELEDFEGTVYLPRSGVRVSATTSSGNIIGEIASRGIFATKSGYISLKIMGPIAITTETKSGDVDVRGMIGIGQHSYNPPTGTAIGTLSLRTKSGDIKVKYVAG